MPFHRSRLVVAFDASAVSAARASWGLAGPGIEACAVIPLPPGALRPAPFESNLPGAPAVRDGLRELRRAMGEPDRGAILVLPSWVARTALLDPPDGAAPREYARFRLTQGLPYSPSEALVDVLPVGRGRFLGAAVRRSIVAEYEESASAAGWSQERLDLAPLAALDGLLRRTGDGGDGVDLILGDVSLSLAAHRDGGVQVFRSRLRDPDSDEPARVQAEAERTAAAAGLGSLRLRVVGSGARSMIHALSFQGLSAAAGWETPVDGLPAEACELAWLGAAR